jgi:inosine/xanthosine triphosphatase
VTLVVVASQNPVKIEAAKIGFARMFSDVSFEFRGISVPSEVSDQPMSRQETLQGAINRSKNALLAMPQAQYSVGIEGGIEENDGRLEAFAWVIIQKGEQIGRAQTGIFYLPDEVAQLIHEGKELGEADDIVFARNNSKQATGSIGILTDDAYTRTVYYANAVIMALIPFKKTQLTWK